MVLPLSCAAAETFKIRAEPFYGDSRGAFPRGSLRLRHRAFPTGAETFGFLRNGFGNRVFPSPSWRKANMHVRRRCSHSRRSCSHSSLKAARAARVGTGKSRAAQRGAIYLKGALAGASKNDFANGKFPPEIILIPTKFIFFQSRTSMLDQNPSATESGRIF